MSKIHLSSVIHSYNLIQGQLKDIYAHVDHVTIPLTDYYASCHICEAQKRKSKYFQFIIYFIHTVDFTIENFDIHFNNNRII
ncbi:unnamed protein product [Heterobilharzia americana]|nr:unnamed protein product [Heterobilharzia americana]